MASEAAKPDYLDLDGDGNRKEPMKKAAADRKKTSAKIDEISRDTARSYIRKAAQPKTGEPAKKDRTAGIERAGKKAYGIGGEPRVRATEGAKRAVEPGAVATAQVKKMGPKYWTGDKLTKPGITKRDEIIAAIEKDQGVNEAKRTHAQVRKELDRVNDRIEKIVKDGGRVPLNDPLSKQLRDLKSELKSLKESRLHARLMEDSITNAEAIMAAQDMVDRIQGMLEDVGQMINEEIPPLTDSIRGAIGAPQSDQFKSSVTGSLNSLMEAVRTARESMEGAVRALSGEAPAPMSSADTDSDEELDIADLDSGDGFDASDAATGGDLPLGRAAR